MSKKRTSELTSHLPPRVLVTRTAEQAPVLSDALRRIGVEPVVVPTIEIVPPASFDELDRAIADLARIDYLILTSVNAVNAFFARLRAKGQGIETLADLTIVAVGPKSAEAIVAHGAVADLVPQDYRAEGVIALLKERVDKKRLLYPKAALARELIPTGLEAAGAEVIAPVAYTSAPPLMAREQLKQALDKGLDLLTFTASSTVQNFVDLLDDAEMEQAVKIPVASIGPLTSETAQKHNFTVAIEPDRSTLDDLVAAIDQYFSTH